MVKVFKEFLKHKEAWDLACSIDGTPANWWTQAIKHNKLSKPLYTYDTVGGYRHRYEQEYSIKKSVEKDEFTYKFHRTTPHIKTCKCWECKFKKEVLESKEFIDFLKKETSLKNPVLFETFTAAYHPGDFLGRHTDENRGIAFIFHLSWKWKPEYGGLFHVENEEGFQTYVPGWGDLVLMELGDKGETHFVSEVSPLAPRPRISIGGWFNEGSE